MTFATNSVYASPVTGDLVGEAVQTEMAPEARANGFVGTKIICADHLNFEIADARGLAAEWGDGADGALHITGDGFTLTRDHSFTTVSFGAGHSGHIDAAGWKLRVKHLDLRNAQAGAIRCNGNPGSAIVPGSGKGFGGSLPPGKPGARDGVPAESVTVVLGGIGGVGGGFAGGFNPTGPPTTDRRLYLPEPGPIWASLGGSSGSKELGGDEAAGGGGGGGYLYVRAALITCDGTTEAGALAANGGAGEAGETNSSDKGLGGGGGGGGGVADIAAGGVIGAGITAIVSASGGDGGDGGESVSIEDGDGGWGGSGGIISIRIGATHKVTLGGPGGEGDLGIVGTPGAGGAGGTCEAALSTAPSIASILGAEPPVYLHADDVEEADGVAVATWTGRTTYDGTGVASPAADVDGWGGTHKGVVITGSAYVSLAAAAAAFGHVGTPVTGLLACQPTNSGTVRVLVGWGDETSSFPFRIVHLQSGDAEFWSNNGDDQVRTTGSEIINLEPCILGWTYDGANVTLIQRTASGDVTLLDNEAHAPTGDTPFETYALGRLDRGTDYGPCPMIVRAHVAMPFNVSVPALVAAMDYLQYQDNCPL